MKVSILAAVLALSLSACTSMSGKPVTPQQSVFALKSSYSVPLRAAVAYNELPRCTEVVKTACSKQEIVAQLRKANQVADISLDAAESAVRTPGVGDDAVKLAYAAANSALQALAAIIATLGVK